jgi:putative hydrolase of the HAD superfamily
VIKALTVDANGVLLLPDPDVLRSSLAAFDAQPDDARCFRAHYEMIYLLDGTSEPDWPSMNRSFAAALGVPKEYQVEAGNKVVADVYLGTSCVAAPGAGQALRRLFESGFGLAVVSNSSHGEIAELLLRTQLCGVSGDCVAVSAVIDSEVVGIKKPDPRVFDLALSALEASPSECVHVGDSVRDDVRGAEAAGLGAVHIDPLGLCIETDHAHFDSFALFATNLLEHQQL